MTDEQVTNDAGNAPAPQESTPEVSELETLRKERDENYDRFVRKVAEFDNYRKRVERERREQADRTVSNLLEQLLGVVDDFDLALSASAADVASYKKGVEMINAKLSDLLRKQGVKPIDALGTDFDPNLHEAVMQEPAADGQRDNEVTAVLRQGYTLNDRLLRAAAVKVARA